MDITTDTLNENVVTEIPETVPVTAQAAFRIPLETIIYIALIVLAMVLRVPGLGSRPLSDSEAHEALTAYRAINPSADPRPEGAELIPQNPLMFSANAIAMVVAGADTSVPLFPTALVGGIMVLLPALFRRWIGSAAALIASALLALSPVLLLGSRTMSPAIWSAALVLLGLYLVGRFVESRAAVYGISATAVFAVMVLMAEPGAFIMLLGALVGIVIAVPGGDTSERRDTFWRTIREWPYLRGVLIGAIVIGLVGTVFMLYPRGLTSIGEMLGNAVRSIVIRPAGTPFAYPLLNSLLYEPILWVFGLFGIYQLFNSDDRSSKAYFVYRALFGWFIFSVIASLVYQGGLADHALWFTIPLAGLSTIAIQRLLTPVYDRFWDVPLWGPFLHGLAVVAILSIAGINFVIIGHAIVQTLPDATPTLDQPFRLVYVVLAVVLLVITFFLIGSIWGARAAWRGMGIGLLTFLGLFSISSGWRAALTNINDPRELWNLTVAADNLSLMEDTLITASKRSTTSPYDAEILLVVGEGENKALNDSGALAWALRYFNNIEYVKELAPTTNAPALIMDYNAAKPDVSSAYVGQDFPIHYQWNPASLSWDVLSWIYDRTAREPAQGTDRVIVWVRSDVYGVPPVEEAQPADVQQPQPQPPQNP